MFFSQMKKRDTQDDVGFCWKAAINSRGGSVIFCLEGASSIGKTTLSRSLAQSAGFHAVPEVRELFIRPSPEPLQWYLECQIKRWEMATHHPSILDGDPFQPLWYSWIYPEDGLQSLETLNNFYRPLFESNQIRFPDRYIILMASDATLSNRQIQDQNRKRSNFLKHLRLIAPQKKYFEYMKTLSKDRVQFISAETTKEELKQRTEILISFDIPETPTDLPLFDSMVTWLRNNPPN